MKRTLSFLAVFTALQAHGAVYYVSPTGSNTNGLSWATAYTNLTSALSVAIAGDDIWVAAGIYKPTSGTNRSYTFFMKNGVDVYGGFLGTETALNQRNIAGAPTTLSGDIGQTGSITDNSYNVVYVDGLTTTITIDGFRIIDGNSNSRGGGVYIKDSPSGLVVLQNCTVYNNWAYAYGGGICVDGGSCRIANCQILNNNCDRYGGGGIAVLTGTSGGISGNIAVLNCLISGNTGTEDGAAIYHIGDGEFYLDRCVITNNTGFQSIVYAEGSYFNVQFYNSLFVGNVTTYSFGTTIYVDVWGNVDVATFTNLTIAHNRNTSTSTSYGAMYLGDAGYHLVRNCIIYGNTPTYTTGKQIYNGGSVTNSIVEGGFTGGINVINANPQFTSPANLSWAPFDGTTYDYTCSLLSPAIDAGNNIFLDTTYFYRDLASVDRVHGGIVDMGAYENQYCVLNTSINVPTDTVLCTGESVSLTAAGGGTGYLWSTGSTQSSITVSAAGTYRVTVTDSGSGCKGTATRTLTAMPVAVDITGDLTSCIGDITRLSATGSNQSFLWSTGDSTSYIDISTGGTYSVTATTLAGGCTATDQVAATFAAKPVAGISFTENSGVANNDGNVCAGNAVTLTATGGTSYVWNIGSSGASISPVVTSSTSYFAHVFNSSGCSAYTDTIGITAVPNPPVTITGVTKACAGQSASLAATGSSAGYSWSTGATVSSITITASGTYSVTVDNGAGCSATDSHVIDISSPQPTINFTEQSGIQPQDGIICAGYIVNLSATGGTSFNWNTSSSTSGTIQVTPPVGTTMYTVSTTDAGGCTGRDTVNITANSNPVINFTFPDSVRSDGASFSLTATPSGGTFSGNNGISGNSFFPTNLFTGQYTITYSYTDQNGCSAVPVTETLVIYDFNSSIGTPTSTQVKVFPNPAADMLHVVSGENGVQHYTFTDIPGKEIYSGTFINTLQLDLTSLTSGSYLLHIGGKSWRVVKP